MSEVRVELVRIEKFGNVQRDHTADRVVLEPEGSLPAGQIKRVAFPNERRERQSHQP